MKKLLIIGTGSTAIHAFEFIQNYNLFDVIGFAVDDEYYSKKELKGLPIYRLSQIENKFNKSELVVFVALLWNKLNAERRDLYLKLKERDFLFANLISPNSIVRGNLIGDNCWIHDYVIIQNDAVINSNVMIMAYSLIGASSCIKSHCFIGAKAVVAGNCSVGTQTFIGINSTIFDDRNVGEKCIIGACSIVKRNVPDFCLYKTKTDESVLSQRNENDIENKLLFSKNIK